MPRKKILTKDQIILSAFNLVREKGIDKLSSRSLSKTLNTSTQPIFSLFSSMDEILSSVKSKAYETYDRVVKEALNQEYKPFKAVGTAYIDFAIQEPNLFRLIFMSPNDHTYSHFNIDHNYGMIIEEIKNEFKFDERLAKKLYFESWIFAHGLAVCLVTKTVNLTGDEISEMLTDVVKGTYMYISKENN